MRAMKRRYATVMAPLAGLVFATVALVWSAPFGGASSAFAKCDPTTPIPGRNLNDWPSSRLEGSYSTPNTGVGGTWARLWNYSPWVHYRTSTTSTVSA